MAAIRGPVTAKSHRAPLPEAGAAYTRGNRASEAAFAAS
jgi:hypothetical protein